MTCPRVKVVKRPLVPYILTFLYPVAQPAIFMWTQDRRGPNTPCPPVITLPSPMAPSPHHSMENTFIDALVNASNCRQHAQPTLSRYPAISPRFTYNKVRRKQFHTSVKKARNIQISQLQTRCAMGNIEISRQEYIQLLDYYHDPCIWESPSISYESHSTLTTQSFGHIEPLPGVTKMNNEGDPPVNSVEILEPPVHSTYTEDIREKISPAESRAGSQNKVDRELNANIWAKPLSLPRNQRERLTIETLEAILSSQESDADAVFGAYSQLPSPGVSYLNGHSRLRLLLRLSDIEIKNKHREQLRYLSVIDDMKAVSLPLNEAQWNTAIAFTGRTFARVQAADVASALRIWKEMEQDAGIESGNVTFNILFDIAIKSQKYGLADMILNEMAARGLRFNRYSRVALIYYRGLKGDGNGVRKAYREYVEAGEIVDTVVLNCVIASLIRAGEPSAAEHVFDRMKRLLQTKTGIRIPFYDWRDVKDSGRVLERLAYHLRGDYKQLQEVQGRQFLAPDLKTYSMFIQHHVSRSGSLRRVAALLSEMAALSIPIHGSIFRKLFEGFARHGGIRYTVWTPQRLESVFRSLIVAVEEETKDVHVSKWMAIWVIRAFDRCCDSKRTLEIWSQLRLQWRVVDEHDRTIVESMLRDVLRKSSKDEDL